MAPAPHRLYERVGLTAQKLMQADSIIDEIVCAEMTCQPQCLRLVRGGVQQGCGIALRGGLLQFSRGPCGPVGHQPAEGANIHGHRGDVYACAARSPNPMWAVLA